MASTKPSPAPAPDAPRSRHALAATPLALASGVCASLASVATKLAVHPTLQQFLGRTESDLVLRAASGAAVIVANVAMWILFSRALSVSTSTVQVTTTNTFANMLCTAVVGTLVFHEHLSLQFWVGLALVFVGTLLLDRPSADANAKIKTD
ncbi:hypothetical protein GGF32_008930 [Allomyces javanicus]|nr:hypothetical protein GGF32_008930 [Allomyces javanicus]